MLVMVEGAEGGKERGVRGLSRTLDIDVIMKILSRIE